MQTAVVAVLGTNGIGMLDGRLPWHPHRLSFDMSFLSLVTTNGYTVSDSRFTVNEPVGRNAVVMGRKTFESLPPRMRPLPNRRNLILTRGNNNISVETAGSLDQAVVMCPEPLFILGGKAVYEEAMQKQKVPFLVTKIHHFPDNLHAEITLDLSVLTNEYKCTDITSDVYDELLRLKPELREKGQLVDNVIQEGDFRYSFLYYHI